MNLITYDIKGFSENSPVQSRKCNGIVFKNHGDVDATINDMPLPAGETCDDFAHNFPGEVVANQFDLKFKIGTSGTNKLVTVIRIYREKASPSETCHFKKS